MFWYKIQKSGDGGRSETHGFLRDRRRAAQNRYGISSLS